MNGKLRVKMVTQRCIRRARGDSVKMEVRIGTVCDEG